MIYFHGSFGHKVTSVNSWLQPLKKIQILIKTRMQAQPRKKMRALIRTWTKKLKDQLQRLRLKEIGMTTQLWKLQWRPQRPKTVPETF